MLSKTNTSKSPIVIFRKTLLVSLFFLLAACSQLAIQSDLTQPDILKSKNINNEINALGIKNLRMPNRIQMASGQPSQSQLEALAKLGVQRVINLRPVSEQSWDEKSLVESYDMEYVSLPIAGSAGATIPNPKVLDKLLKNSNKLTLVHCASSNRVGALVALNAALIESSNIDTAIAIGKDWGLTSLGQKVRNLVNTREDQ